MDASSPVRWSIAARPQARISDISVRTHGSHTDDRAGGVPRRGAELAAGQPALGVGRRPAAEAEDRPTRSPSVGSGRRSSRLLVSWVSPGPSSSVAGARGRSSTTSCRRSWPGLVPPRSSGGSASTWPRPR
jgi:hypothetical protein